MSRIPIGLLCEHLCCTRGDVFAHAVPETDADDLLSALDARRAEWLAVPLHATDTRAVFVLANMLFTVARPVAEMGSVTDAHGRLAGKLRVRLARKGFVGRLVRDDVGPSSR